MAYAHALIEVPVDPEDATKGVVKYGRGDEVPADLPGYDELVEGGSIRDEVYDPEADKSPAPDTVEIDGVKYIKVADGAQEDSNVRV